MIEVIRTPTLKVKVEAKEVNFDHYPGGKYYDTETIVITDIFDRIDPLADETIDTFPDFIRCTVRGSSVGAPDHFDRFTFYTDNNYWQIEVDCFLDPTRHEVGYTWGPVLYMETLGQVIEAEFSDRLSFQPLWEEYGPNELGCVITFSCVYEYRLGDAIAKCMQELVSIHGRAADLIRLKNASAPLSAYFEFPSHLRNACCQYLQYFSEFLIDLGLQADTKLEQHGCHVLFSVTPANRAEALERLSQALAAFLALPATSEFRLNHWDLSAASEVYMQKLKANIDHLHSQLRLSEASIMMQQRHISMLQDHCTMLGQCLLQSLEAVKVGDEEDSSIAFLKGTLEITKVEGKGFSINLPKILRLIRESITENPEE